VSLQIRGATVGVEENKLTLLPGTVAVREQAPQVALQMAPQVALQMAPQAARQNVARKHVARKQAPQAARQNVARKHVARKQAPQAGNVLHHRGEFV